MLTYHPFDKEPNTITVDDGKKVEVKHIGSIKLANGVLLEKVLHVLGLHFNLIPTHNCVLIVISHVHMINA